MNDDIDVEVDINESEIEEDIEDDTPTKKFPFEKDKVMRITEKLPGPLRTWTSQGSFNVRLAKLIGLVSFAVFLVVAVIFLGLIITISLFSGSNDDCADCDGVLWSDYRLPKYIKPNHYNIYLEPDFETFTFNGVVTIQGELLESFRTIVIHTDDIEIKKATLTLSHEEKEEENNEEDESSNNEGKRKVNKSINKVNDHSSVQPTAISYNEDLTFAYLSFEEILKKNNGFELVIEYTGNLNDEMKGFYRSKYTDQNTGEEKWLGTTQFESTDARRAFPCFDEPEYKSTFQVQIKLSGNNKDLVALNNMPIESTDDNVVTFGKSPIMSSYLVAFAVGDFERVHDVDDKGREYSVWTVPGKSENGNFALQVAINSIAWFENYYNIDYPLPKLDLLAVPDFAAGAMENWGLVTFRETALLLDDTTPTGENAQAYYRQRVAGVTAHELAHQWTGDLVTTEWWENLWLNEGFADYFEYECLNGIYPDWGIEDQFIRDYQQTAFETDGLKNSHPLYNPVVQTPGEISEMFSKITYQKGASILRMISNYMEPDNFQDGLRNYISDQQYNVANYTDLFTALSSVDKSYDIYKFENWITYSGFPIINLEETSDSAKLKASQEQFFLEPLSERSDSSKSNKLWFLPIVIQTDSGDFIEMETDEKEFTINLNRQRNWIKVNYQQNGFYRVNYPTSYWNKFPDHMDELSTADRTGLLNDAFVLSFVGYVDSNIPLNLATTLRTENEYPVWMSSLTSLNQIGDLLSDEPVYYLYKKFMRDILRNIVNTVGWNQLPGESHSVALLRTNILMADLHYGVQESIDTAFEFWNSGNDIPSNIRTPVYYAAARYGNDDDFKKLAQLFLFTDDSAEENRILSTIGSTRELYLLEFILKNSLNTDAVRPQDRVTLINSVASNPLGRELAFNFVADNWDEFNKPGFGITNLIRDITRHFDTEKDLNMVKTFFDSHPPNGGALAVKQAYETIQANIIWKENNLESVEDWLNDHYSI